MRVRAGKQLRTYNHCRNQVNKGHANPHQGARILPVRFGQRNLRQRSSRGARRTPEARTSASWDLVRCLRCSLVRRWRLAFAPPSWRATWLQCFRVANEPCLRIVSARRPVPCRHQFKCEAALTALEVPLPFARRAALAQRRATARAIHLALVLEKLFHFSAERSGNGFGMLFAASYSENVRWIYAELLCNAVTQKFF
jgi:hypothetical protein